MKLKLKEITLFALLGTVMFVSKILMEFLPNIHVLGVLIALYTAVFGVKAIYPIIVYIALNGVYAGFALWWVPYIYIWPLLWVALLLVKQSFAHKTKIIFYTLITTLHGLLFGVLYAPMQSLMFGFNFKQTVTWVIAGFPFDAIHAAGNLVLCLIILPFTPLFKKAVQNFY
jgi:energy-coupling factor transport system substrate-specific component